MTAGARLAGAVKVRVEDGMPVLGAGKHRWPRRGACLMEYTAVLAGERRSDSPRCTDPVLAEVARAVNDYTSDGARQRLAVLASELTTARGAGSAGRQAVARRCLLTALPYATGDRRRVLIVAVLGLDRAAAGRSRGWSEDTLSLDAELALLAQQVDVERAGAFVGQFAVGEREYARRALPKAIDVAVATIAEWAPNSDDVLRRLLADCISDYRALVPGERGGSARGRRGTGASTERG